MNTWDGFGPLTVRPRGYKAKNNTKTPRTRDGATYPGGRHLRKAMARLSARVADYERTISSTKKGASGYSKPGSMKW